MSRTAPTTALETGARAGGRLGLALLVIATAQLMMVLDDTVANVALPSIQAQSDMSESALPWVINAYVLAFGAAIGLAVLTTVSATAAATRLPDAATALHAGSADGNGDLVTRAQQALSHGYTTAYLAAAVQLVAAAVITAVTVTTRNQQKSAAAADIHAG